MSTNCVFPPELDDKQLLAYFDNPTANQEIAQHLQKCSYCRGKAEDLERFQQRLTRELYRINCPSPIELGEFQLQMLPASRRLVVAQHVRECPHCERELSQLKAYLREGEPQSSLIRTIKVLVAQLVSGGETKQSSSFAGLRGAEDEPFIYQADNIRIVIEVQEDVEQMELKTLVGLVTGLETDHFTIQLSQQDQVVANTSVDEIGNFTISGLVPSHYHLILNGPNMEIHIQSLPVG